MADDDRVQPGLLLVPEEMMSDPSIGRLAQKVTEQLAQIGQLEHQLKAARSHLDVAHERLREAEQDLRDSRTAREQMARRTAVEVAVQMQGATARWTTVCAIQRYIMTGAYEGDIVS